MAKPSWKDEFYVRAYQLARTGMSDRRIGDSLGVAFNTFQKWLANRPALRRAIDEGRQPVHSPGTLESSQSKVQSLPDFVYKSLSPKLRDLWTKMCKLAKDKRYGQLVDSLLNSESTVVRQQLFLHALVVSCWNPSEACRRVNISRQTYERWVADDPNFAKLQKEMEWHKDNYFEQALHDLVRSRDVTATLFYAKTKLRHRGYQEKTVVEGSVQHHHLHAIVDVGELARIPLVERQRMLELAEAKAIVDAPGTKP